jgi:hypothetical protein
MIRDRKKRELDPYHQNMDEIGFRGRGIGGVDRGRYRGRGEDFGGFRGRGDDIGYRGRGGEFRYHGRGGDFEYRGYRGRGGD